MELTWEFRGGSSGVVIPIVGATYTETEGEGGAECVVQLANWTKEVEFVTSPTADDPPTWTLSVNAIPVFTTRELPTSRFNAQRGVFELALTLDSALKPRRLESPREAFTWPLEPNGDAGLHALLHFTFGFLGFDTVQTNLPNVLLPVVEFTPYESVYQTAMGVLDVFAPVVLENPATSTVRVFDVATSFPVGAPLPLPPRIQLNAGRPLERYPVINQIELHTAPHVHGDGPQTHDCPLVPRETDSEGDVQLPGGERVARSSDTCGGFLVNFALLAELSAEITLGEPLRVATPPTYKKRTPETGESESSSEVPAVTDLEEDEPAHYAETTPIYANLRTNPLDPLSVVRTVPIGSIEELWASSGEHHNELVSRTTTALFFLRGTNLSVPAGSQSVVSALAKSPGIADPVFFDPLSVKTSWIEYERREQDEADGWRRIAETASEAGWFLVDDRTPLQVANKNDTVNTTSTTDQDIDWGALKTRVEWLSSVGTDYLNFSFVEYDELRGIVETGGDKTGIGSTAGAKSKPEPIVTLLVDEDLIRTYGPRPRVVLDLTRYGDAGLEIGRWKAARLFARSGKPVERASVTLPFAMPYLHRGDYVTVEEQAAHVTEWTELGSAAVDYAGSKTYLVTGVALSLANLAAGQKTQVATTLSLLAVHHG